MEDIPFMYSYSFSKDTKSDQLWALDLGIKRKHIKYTKIKVVYITLQCMST